MTSDNAMVKPENDQTKALARYLDSRSKRLAQYAVSRIKPDVLIRLALFEFAKPDNNYLRQCTPESIYASLVLAAQIGLEPSGIRGEAYLVPFKGRCTLIPGYRGLIKLALRSKAVKSIDSFVVYERDEFRVWLGSDPRIEHRPELSGDRGDIVAAYAVAHLENGATQIEVMTIEELEKIKNFAAKNRGGNAGPAYNEWESEMFRKAPVRRLCKRLPLGDDFFLAAKADELSEAGEPEKISSYLEVDATEQHTPGAAHGESLGDQVAARADQARARRGDEPPPISDEEKAEYQRQESTQPRKGKQ